MESLRNKAMALLARREHSRLELARKLSDKAEGADIDALLDELAADDLQSDHRFAESYVRSRQLSGYGPIRIRQELLQRGVVEPLIDTVLPVDEEDWRELLQQVWQKKYRGLIPDDARAYGQQVRFLLQRGFSGEMVGRFLKMSKECQNH